LLIAVPCRFLDGVANNNSNEIKSFPLSHMKEKHGDVSWFTKRFVTLP